MTEKIIHEFKFIETDDGFRVEINGDKEMLKKMGFGPKGMFGSFGFGRFGRRPGRHRRRRHCHDRGRHGHRHGTEAEAMAPEKA